MVVENPQIYNKVLLNESFFFYLGGGGHKMGAILDKTAQSTYKSKAELASFEWGKKKILNPQT